MKPAGSFIQIHYHSRPGGVTTVMQEYSLAFRRVCGDARGVNLVVCARTGAAGAVGGAQMIDVKECEYRVFKTHTAFVKAKNDLLRQMGRIMLHGGLSRPVSIVGHNLNLGKNCALSSAFAALARRCARYANGYRFFSVIHDFAEEGRAGLIAKITAMQKFGTPVWRDLYPVSPNVCFVALNSRNYNLLRRAGYTTRLLKNPVAAPFGGGAPCAAGRKKTINALSLLARRDNTAFRPAAPLLFYPSRIIARKNPVEAILLSHFFFSSNLLLAGPGTSIADRALSAHLKRLCVQYKVSAVFDCNRIAGFAALQGAAPFHLLYGASDACITTSVLEGFGYALYEPWLYGKGVIGRMPKGSAPPKEIDLSGLYKRLFIPKEWIFLDKLKHRYYQRMQQCFKGGDVVFACRSFSQRFNRAFLLDGGIDFGCLDSGSQCAILESLLKSSRLVSEWKRAFPAQTEALMESWAAATRFNSQLVARNRRAVDSLFAEAAYTKSFSRCFFRKSAGRLARSDRRVIGQYFCDPRAFCLLQTPHFAEQEHYVTIFA